MYEKYNQQCVGYRQDEQMGETITVLFMVRSSVKKFKHKYLVDLRMEIYF